MNDLSYIFYNAKLMLVDTMDMDTTTELAHRRLCDWVWACGEFPLASDEKVRAISRVAERDWVRVKGELLLKGWKEENDRFCHSGAMNAAELARRKHIEASEKGRNAAGARWAAEREVEQSTSNAQEVPEQCKGNSRPAIAKERKEKEGSKKEEGVEVVFPETLNTESFKAAWGEWERYRKEKRRTLTASTVSRQLGFLSSLGVDRAVAAINQSILNGWQGLFDPQQVLKTGGANTVIQGKEYERILSRMKAISDRIESHMTFSELPANLKEEYRTLKARKAELQKVLGVTI